MKVKIPIKGPVPLFEKAQVVVRDIKPFSEVEIEIETEVQKVFDGGCIFRIEHDTGEVMFEISKDRIFFGYTDENGQRVGYEYYSQDEYFKDEKVRKFMDRMLEKVKGIRGELKFFTLEFPPPPEVIVYLRTDTPLFLKKE